MAISSFAVFLRGVNVGGVTIKSAALRECFEGVSGVEQVATVLATGNVVVRSSLTATALKKAAEQALRDEFRYAAWVVVFPVTEVRELAEACPYPTDSQQTHAYLTLSSDPAALDDVERETVEEERTRLSRNALAWPCPVGKSLDVPMAKVLARTAFKESVTTRNARTLDKVLAAARRL